MNKGVAIYALPQPYIVLKFRIDEYWFNWVLHNFQTIQVCFNLRLSNLN